MVNEAHKQGDYVVVADYYENSSSLSAIFFILKVTQKEKT